MPQLIRLRFINLGHENARTEDLIVPLHDKHGQAADSIIWARNGGGKSMLLGLFLALINPHQKQFLGSITNQGTRRFEHYVPKASGDNRAILVAEWQSEEMQEGFPARYLTGYFCEWRQDNLERLFFSSRVSEPEITFETIPVKMDTGEWRTLYSFRHAWQNLAKLHPAAESHETTNQKTWREILEGARIDPELFNYQIYMNSEEGGADKLFSKFSTTDHFVDFFIKMVMSSDQNDAIAKSLDAFRQRAAEHRSRQTELLLVESLKPLIEPMIEVAAQRQAQREYAGELQSSVRHLQTMVEAHQTANERKITQTGISLSAAKSSAERATKEAHLHNERMLSFERQYLEQRAARLLSEKRELEEKLSKAAHAHLLWKSAWSFSEVARLESVVRSLEEDLEAQSAEFAPDWDKVHVSAQTLANALFSRAEENRQQAQSKIDEAISRRAAAIEARQKSNEAHSEAGSLKNQSQSLTKRIEQARIAQMNLETDETLASNESTESALERHHAAQRSLQRKEAIVTTEIEKDTRSIDSLITEAEKIGQESVRAQRRRDEAQRILQDALERQNTLLAVPILKRVFGEIGREILTRATVDTLKQEQAAVESKWRDLSAEIAENKLVLEYLQTHNLLPPTRSVRTILSILRDKNITAFAGWRHVADICRERETARTFIAAHPEIALGVIVHNKDFEAAKSALLETDPPLSSAVVVVSRNVVDDLDTGNGNSPDSGAAKRFVVGPTSDAHFDRAAANDEKIELESQLRHWRIEREEAAEDARELRTTANDLQKFVEEYPPDWFERQKSEFQTAEIYYQECLEEIVRIKNQRTDIQESLNRRREGLKRLLIDKKQTEEYLRRLNRHLERYGSDAQLRETAAQQTKLETQAANFTKEAERLETISESEKEEARRLDDETKKFNENAESDTREIRRVEYLEDETSSVPGDVEALRAIHQALCERINQKTGADAIRTKLEFEKTQFKSARMRFDDECDPAIGEAEIRLALKKTPNKHSIKRRIGETESEKSNLQRLIGKAEYEAAGSEKELEHHQSKFFQFKSALIDEEIDFTESESESRASAARLAMETAQKEADRLADETERREQELRREDSKRKELKSQSTRLENLADDEIFLDAIEISTVDFFSVNEYEDYLERLEKDVPEARKLRTKLIDERGEIHKKIHECLENKPFEFVRPLKIWSVEYFEANAQKALDELETREKTIRIDLERAGAYRKAIVELLLEVAERGITLLREIASSSKLPESAGNLAGHPFLRIKLEVPESRIEKSERIGNLIDDIVRQEKIPETIEIIQRAVRRLSLDRIDVRVLFPDKNDFKPRYRPITMMSAESGGEHLTSAVLIYCALTRLRAKERGLNPKTSSVLLLDNPFGKVTRRIFIELQREMARAMNVQLVYLTGDESLDALSVFPNRVRMRNERRNRATREYLLELVQIVQNEKEEK